MHSLPVGINYEGGKITEYAAASPHCLGYINAQIAMDAPFHDQIAGETVRTLGRSETSMSGYDEDTMISQLSEVVRLIKSFLAAHVSAGPEPMTVIQIARGRSAEATLAILKPILNTRKIDRYIVATGYKSTSYFKDPSEPFVLLNIGMFGRLTQVTEVQPGTIYNPVTSFDLCIRSTLESTASSTVSAESTAGGALILASCVPRCHQESMNLMYGSAFPSLVLLGIEDAMPFVTPCVYKKDVVYAIVDTVLQVMCEPSAAVVHKE